MAIIDRKVQDKNVADATDDESSFAEIDAKQLRRAAKSPGVQKLHAAADKHLERLQAEGRIDI
jgi:hypothetical protein